MTRRHGSTAVHAASAGMHRLNGSAAPAVIGAALRRSPAWSQSPARRIAVFRPLQLGDMLCAVPALRALRAGEPDAHITLIGLPWAREFVARFPALVDDFMAFPGMAGMPEQVPSEGTAPAFYEAARDRHFDLAIQLHGSGVLSNEVTRRLEAASMAGFCPGDAQAGVHRDGAEMLVTWPEGNEIERLLSLMHALGYPALDNRLEFPLLPADLAGWRDLAVRYGLRPGSFVCVHAGARLLSRRWPVERFAEAARTLRRDWPIVVTGAPDEAALVDRLATLVGAPVVNLCGQTTLGTLAALIANTRLLLCNDTGVSHIAAALRAPSLVVSCGSDSARWSPLDSDRHRVMAAQPPCRPCSWNVCPIGHVCALQVGAHDVASAAREMAARGREHG